jgi:hypothetical protein
VRTNTDRIVASHRNDVEDLRVEFTRTTAPIGEFTTGFVVLKGTTRVRLPVALRPVSVKAPGSVRGTRTDGSVAIPLTAGFNGDLRVAELGLARATSTDGSVAVGDAAAYCRPVAPGSKVLKVVLDASQDDADLDLYVVKTDAACRVQEFLAGESSTTSADESVTIPDPEPGGYLVVVDAFAGAPGASTVDYRLDSYDVNPTTSLGRFLVEPNPVSVQVDEPAAVAARWSGLEPGGRYLGVLEYHGALDRTYVEVTADP